MAHNYGTPPIQGPQHERLAAFVGTWHAAGLSFATNMDPSHPRGAAETWVSDEVTEWHPGQFFVVQHEVATAGSAPLITHAVIGLDAASDDYMAHAFENHGHYRRYMVRVVGRTWTFTGDTERARVEFSEDGNTQTVRWEWRPEGDAWLPLCDRTNVRAHP
jgi:hypothetical protein